MGKITIDQSHQVIATLKTIKIDRSVPFDPVPFLGKGGSIEKEDKRALALTEIDINNVRLEAMLNPGETCVNGEEKLKRLKKAGHIRLDAKIFQIFWENQHLIPEEWKEKTNGNTTYISFDGTVLQNSNCYRGVLCLYWRDGRWNWKCCYLGDGRCANYLSAVLAS